VDFLADSAGFFAADRRQNKIRERHQSDKPLIARSGGFVLRLPYFALHAVAIDSGIMISP
jgi:hypothetical protein